jgi:2-polyprenyl-3-methyl-5-hydroxy-6-metoxy-1,4-benzoquinol methylase
MTALVHVACPRCGADDAGHRLDLAQSAIVSCRPCGMSYVNPRVAPAHIHQKLQAWAEQDVVDEERLRIAFEAGNLAHYGRLLDALAAQARGPGRTLLDVGCSTGAFLTVARDAGWDARGLEIGAASAAYARDTLKLDVRRGSLYEFDAPEASLDAVALLEVIEHLEHPADAVRRIARLLRPDGLLLVTTPNFDSLYRRLFGNRWWVVNCEDEHIVLFNLATLEGLLRENGFEIEFRRIRGLDLLGLARQAKGALFASASASAPTSAASEAAGYYTQRASITRAKLLLSMIGALGAAKSVLRGLDRTYTWGASPTYAWGEQLVVIARRAA